MLRNGIGLGAAMKKRSQVKANIQWQQQRQQRRVPRACERVASSYLEAVCVIVQGLPPAIWRQSACVGGVLHLFAFMRIACISCVPRHVERHASGQ